MFGWPGGTRGSGLDGLRRPLPVDLKGTTHSIGNIKGAVHFFKILIKCMLILLITVKRQLIHLTTSKGQLILKNDLKEKVLSFGIFIEAKNRLKHI